ncbi:hypothetical protein ACQKLX_00490 [Bosea sp. NPDC003192]|jgi:hypothetical protein|uniref:hypothetical protein n=1 Tax=Bosea sp. NPDC003192 TaxID=3390551 RepID=UPI003D020FCD
MSRNLAILALAAFGLGVATPATAFWERSQWRVCSEGTTAAEYQRWRCWELDGYAGEIAPGYDAWPGGQMPPQKRPLLRRGGSVSRLG